MDNSQNSDFSTFQESIYSIQQYFQRGIQSENQETMIDQTKEKFERIDAVSDQHFQMVCKFYQAYQQNVAPPSQKIMPSLINFNERLNYIQNNLITNHFVKISQEQRQEWLIKYNQTDFYNFIIILQKNSFKYDQNCKTLLRSQYRRHLQFMDLEDFYFEIMHQFAEEILDEVSQIKEQMDQDFKNHVQYLINVNKFIFDLRQNLLINSSCQVSHDESFYKSFTSSDQPKKIENIELACKKENGIVQIYKNSSSLQNQKLLNQQNDSSSQALVSKQDQIEIFENQNSKQKAYFKRENEKIIPNYKTHILMSDSDNVHMFGTTGEDQDQIFDQKNSQKPKLRRESNFFKK